MLKKILIAVAVLAVIGVIAAGIAFYKLNGTYGLTTARLVNHESLTNADTRVRVSIDTLRLGREALPYLPEDPPLPSWLPWNLPDLLPKVLPREIAILGGSNYADGAFNLTVFVNEQKGGHALPTYLNQQAKLSEKFPAVQWDPEGFRLQERGILTVDGNLPLPDGLEDHILETWSLDPPEMPMPLLGGHLAEGVVDNRNGEIVTLVGALAPAWGTTLERLENDQNIGAVMGMLAQVFDIRVAVDLPNPDTLLIQIRIHADKEVGGQLEFFIPFAMPGLAQQLKAKYGLTLESKNHWNIDEEVYTSDLSIVGIEERLRNYIHAAIPSRQGATPQ